jgi:hypothetical protein
MSGEECFPRHPRAAFWCGLDAVVLQDRLDRIPSDVMSEVLQPAPDARVGKILVCHADDERCDVRPGGRATRPPRQRTVVLLGDESPVPTQDRVRCDDARDSRAVTTAEDVTFHGEMASLVVGQAQSSGTVHLRGAIFLERKVNDGLPVSIDPAREQHEEEGERGRQRVHGGSLPQCQAPFNWCQIDIVRRHTGLRFPRKSFLPRLGRTVLPESGLGRVVAQDGVLSRVTRARDARGPLFVTGV